MAAKRMRKSRTGPRVRPDSGSAPAVEPLQITQGHSWTDRPRLVAAIVIALASAVYVNCLPNQFAYDDQTIIGRNPRIESPANFREIWLTDWWYVPPEQSEERHRDRLYRPLVIQSFALNYALSGTGTWSYHLADIALHATCCVIIVALTRRLFGDSTVAAWTGILFAVLPVHSESVAYLVGRADVTGALFCVLGMYCLSRELSAQRRARRAAWKLGALACVPLGLFCKEQAVCLPALLLATECYLRATRRGLTDRTAPTGLARFALRRALTFYLWTLLAIGAYLALRYTALQGHLVRDVIPSPLDNPLSRATAVERFWTPFKLLAQYVLVSVWPANLCSDYSYNAFPLPKSPADLKTLCGIMLCAGGVWACIRSYQRRKIILFIGAFFLSSYALISNAVLIIGTIVGERLFYLPSLAVCWLVVLLLGELATRLRRSGALAGLGRRFLPMLAWCAIAVFATRTVMRTFDWRDGKRLFAVDIQTHPNSARLQLFRAKVLVDEEELDRALEHLKKSLEIFPQYADAHALSGYIQAVTGNWPVARKHYYLALQLWRENPKVQAQYESFRQLHEAGGLLPLQELPLVERAAATQPANTDLQRRLADLQAGLGKYRDAIATLSNILEKTPADRDSRFKLANLLIIDEQADRARELLEALLADDPNDWRAHSHLAFLISLLDAPASLRHARRAVELEPMRFEVRMNLAQALELNRRFDEALNELRALLDVIAPDEPARLLVQRQIKLIEDSR